MGAPTRATCAFSPAGSASFLLALVVVVVGVVVAVPLDDSLQHLRIEHGNEDSVMRLSTLRALSTGVADVDALLLAVLVGDANGPSAKDLQETLNALRIESPDVRVDAMIDAVDAVGNEKAFQSRNPIRDILERIIAKAKEDPEKFADVLIKAFGPMGKAGLLSLLKSLREMRAELPASKELDIIISKVEEALNQAYDVFVNGKDNAALGLRDCLEDLRGKIGKILEEAKSKGKEFVDSLRVAAEEALNRILAASASLEEAQGQFLEEVLKPILEKVKHLADKSSQVAEAVSEALTLLLRRLGTSALKAALKYVDASEDVLGERFHDFLVSKIQEALAEISYVKEVGMSRLFQVWKTL